MTNATKLMAVTKKYTRIEGVKHDGKQTQAVDIYYSYVGIVDVPTDEEIREMEREYMQRTNLQTA